MSSKYHFGDQDCLPFITWAVVYWIDAFTRNRRKNSNNGDFQFWIQDNKPIEIFTRKVFDQKLEYIQNNLVKDGFV